MRERQETHVISAQTSPLIGPNGSATAGEEIAPALFMSTSVFADFSCSAIIDRQKSSPKMHFPYVFLPRGVVIFGKKDQ